MQTLCFDTLTPEQMSQASLKFYNQLKKRRSVRDFSPEPIPFDVLQNCVLAASTAPNGANLQPWHFAIIQSPDVKAKIRAAAEEEERAFYNGRAPEEWLEVLAPLGTNADKPFLEEAPALIAIFRKAKALDKNGVKRKTYYPLESTGIATGILITALHNAGLATLTHTPSPMGFLNELLDRPSSEKPFLLLVAGYPKEDCEVPHISKKPFESICSVY